MLLFICGFEPSDTIDNWPFFVFAFIAGLVFSKLAENAFWTKWTRNPKWAIRKGVDTLNNSIGYKKFDSEHYTKNVYYIEYYCVSKNPIYKTIQILETQYRFVENLILLSIICFVICFCKPCELKQLFCLGCKSGEAIIGIYSFMILFTFVGCIINKFPLPQKGMVELRKTIVSIVIYSLIIVCLIISNWLHIKSFFDSFNSVSDLDLLSLIRFDTSSSYCFIFAALVLLYLAYKIQLKISTLVIEGAYYSNIIDNQKERN